MGTTGLISAAERRIWSPISMCKQNSCTISVSSGTHCTQYSRRAGALTSTWTTIERQTIPVSLVNLILAPAHVPSIVAVVAMLVGPPQPSTLNIEDKHQGVIVFLPPPL